MRHKARGRQTFVKLVQGTISNRLRSASWVHNGAVSRNYLGTSFLELCCPIELSVMMDMFCICVVSYVTTSYMWLSGISKVASATEELNFKLYLILINLDVNSHMWWIDPYWIV